MDTKLMNDIEAYLLKWLPYSNQRSEEIQLVTSMLKEIQLLRLETERATGKAKVMVTLANDWQKKYQECKEQIVVQRARKDHYKDLYQREVRS